MMLSDEDARIAKSEHFSSYAMVDFVNETLVLARLDNKLAS